MTAQEHHELPLLNSSRQPSRIKAHSRQSLLTEWFDDWWLFEIFCALLATTCFVVLAAILSHYNGNTVPQWGAVLGASITLNTVVSLLSVTGQAALLVPVTESISQLKWLWYWNHERPLTDLNMFDQASRGAWGSLALLRKVHIK